MRVTLDELGALRMRREIVADCTGLLAFYTVLRHRYGQQYMLAILTTIDTASREELERAAPRLRNTLQTARLLVPTWGNA